MATDPTSLDRLHDIVLPPATLWWPPASGWLWLLGMVLLVALVLLVRGVAHWQQNRYRHEALKVLAVLESDAADASRQRVVLVEMAGLLKRTAITAYSREQVAALTGPDWFQFLDGAAGTRFTEGPGAALEDANYGLRHGGWDPAKLRELFAETRRWIRHHKPATDLAGLGTGQEASKQAPPPAQARAA